jgi:hypothetical protein
MNVLRFPLVELPVVCAVVGEHRADPMCLLLPGADGQHFACSLLDGSVAAVDPDDDAWRRAVAPPSLAALAG